jgi:hypothetical protein
MKELRRSDSGCQVVADLNGLYCDVTTEFNKYRHCRAGRKMTLPKVPFYCIGRSPARGSARGSISDMIKSSG